MTVTQGSYWCLSYVGVDQVVTVGEHQTMATLSKRYLGPGMECYIEALNGTSTIKSGQKVKIPKVGIEKEEGKITFVFIPAEGG